MKTCIAITCVVILAIPALASEFDNQAPPKRPSTAVPNVPYLTRQGGDTIETAVVIATLPYATTGTTTGYTDDYDEVCPYDSQSADVVYSYQPAVDEVIIVDLCGSAYDTKTYIYDDGFHLVACNDDYYFDEPCGEYRSRIDGAVLEANRVYFLVVDGYGTHHGEYVLSVAVREQCELAYPAEGLQEGEPPLHDDYVDNWNGGCNTNGFAPPFQTVAGDVNGEAILCGVSGWYNFGPQNTRDTDWYLLAMGAAGAVEATLDAESETLILELFPQNCSEAEVVQQVTTECEPVTMTITGYGPGASVWFWVGPTVFYPPSWTENEYDYVLWFSGLETSVATESTTWSTVKALNE